MYPQPVKTEYDREDMFLSKVKRESKRICEYILNQKPLLTPYSAMTGLLVFDGSCVGDAFTRIGHPETEKLADEFYLKAVDNLSTMEAQHASADYKRVLKVGISGIIEEIDKSYALHNDEEDREFLLALKDIATTIIKWAHKCSKAARDYSESVDNPEYKNNLITLADTLLKVPENGATSFYEALLSINLCFSFDPDSFGTLDRYLNDFYENDIKEGIITREKAKEYLQEFLLTPQQFNSHSKYFTRGGQSHFCVGGYLANGTDGFREITRLIIESLMELPTYIPQITFRWTEKTPHDVMKYVMDCERKDKNKRIAFTNDERRLKCLTEICKIPLEKAIEYTMVGCNELTFPGAIIASTSKGNVLRCIDTLFHKKSDIICCAQDFDEFYSIFESELHSDLAKICEYDDKYNLVRGRDINYVSCLFFNGCIENAKSLTRGGGDVSVSTPMLLGMTNLIDSLIAVKQLVYDEKIITMRDLCDALKNDWNGYENIRETIVNKCSFFGNDDDLSNSVAQKIYNSIYSYIYGKRTVFGYPIIFGDHTGYNEHFKWYGEKTGATPDGRKSGAPIKIGIGQSEGKDKNGLTALLSSVAKADQHGVSCGSTVTNVMIDEALVKNDETFEKLVMMFETYFKMGGTHFQLNYVSKEDLIAAKSNPEKYASLRVRVTGYSDYFVNLTDSIQNDIISRTSKKD